MKNLHINKIGFLALTVAFLLTSASDAFAKNILQKLLNTGDSEKSNKQKKEAVVPQSANFFSFNDPVYNTSPDKRIGAKILVDTTKVGPSIASLNHLTYLPGAHVPSHRHVYVTEIIYILDGNLKVRIGTDTRILGKDSTAFIPPKTFHELTNDSADIVQFLQYYSPSGPEEEYRNWENPKTQAAQELASEIEKKTEIKNKGPEEVVAPVQYAVPGSPTTVKMQRVQIEESKPVEEVTPAEEASGDYLTPKVDQKNPKIKELLLDLKKNK